MEQSARVRAEFQRRELGSTLLTSVLEATGVVALGPDMSHASAFEALAVSGKGVLRPAGIELATEAVFDVVRGFAEGGFDFVVVALFRAAAVRERDGGFVHRLPDEGATTRGVTSMVIRGGEGAGARSTDGVLICVAPRTGGAVEGRGGDDAIE